MDTNNLEKRINDLPEKLKETVMQQVDRLEKVVEFSKKIPLFEERIIDNRLVEDNSTEFGCKYKNMYLSWGINRWKCSQRNMTNYEGDFEGYLFVIYVNTLDLYGSHNKYDLHKLSELAYYYDTLNSTFYVEDDKIELFLDSLNEWYLKARDKAHDDSKIKEIEKLKQKLQELEGGHV